MLFDFAELVTEMSSLLCCGSPGDKREQSCLSWRGLPEIASGSRRLVYFGFFHRAPRFLELEVLERASEIKHVIEQHYGHQHQIAAQNPEGQANAWRYRNVAKSFA
jgi:hypothetical protein